MATTKFSNFNSLFLLKPTSRAAQMLDYEGPVPIEQHGSWDPDEEEFMEIERDENDDIVPPTSLVDHIYEDIRKAGKRPLLEFQEVWNQAELEIYDGDPVWFLLEQLRAEEIGAEEFQRKLKRMLKEDQRKLDARAHLGWLFFQGNGIIYTKTAMKHYKAGASIAYHSLMEKAKNGVLPTTPWGWMGNQPFLRCLEGYALCKWRLGHSEDALKLLTLMLWLNPRDNQGARMNIQEILEGRGWNKGQEEREEPLAWG